MFFKPILPPYDPLAWAKKPFPEKSMMACRAWAIQGLTLGVVLARGWAMDRTDRNREFASGSPS